LPAEADMPIIVANSLSTAVRTGRMYAAFTATPARDRMKCFFLS
jgi:hypothetical protein